jgi:putative effector of murein hydrolase
VPYLLARRRSCPSHVALFGPIRLIFVITIIAGGNHHYSWGESSMKLALNAMTVIALAVPGYAKWGTCRAYSDR